MSSYIIPKSIAGADRGGPLLTLEAVEAMRADEGCVQIIPVCGDCLEGAGVPDGGWVAVDFTRFPAPNRKRNQGVKTEDLCLCYAVAPGECSPKVMVKVYVGKWGNAHLVGTKYKSMWVGDTLRMNWAVPADCIFGVIFAAWDSRGTLLWTRDKEEFQETLGNTQTIEGECQIDKLSRVLPVQGCSTVF